MNSIGTEKVHKFLEQYENGTITKLQMDSYFARSIERQSSGSSEIIMVEMIAPCIVSLLVLYRYQKHSNSMDIYALGYSSGYARKGCIPNSLTTNSPVALIKHNRTFVVDMIGITLPKDTTFDPDHITNDPHQVAHTDQLIPERWMAESIQNRKGSNDYRLNNPLIS